MADPGKVMTIGGAGVGVGALAGFMSDPEKGMEVLKWLNESLGPVGFVAIVSLGSGLAVSVFANWLMWQRLKEKDIECQTEMEKTRVRWSSVFEAEAKQTDKQMEGMREDRNDAFKTVAELTKQVTILVEQARSQSGVTRGN